MPKMRLSGTRRFRQDTSGSIIALVNGGKCFVMLASLPNDIIVIYCWKSKSDFLLCPGFRLYVHTLNISFMNSNINKGCRIFGIEFNNYIFSMPVDS